MVKAGLGTLEPSTTCRIKKLEGTRTPAAPDRRALFDLQSGPHSQLRQLVFHVRDLPLKSKANKSMLVDPFQQLVIALEPPSGYLAANARPQVTMLSGSLSTTRRLPEASNHIAFRTSTPSAPSGANTEAGARVVKVEIYPVRLGIWSGSPSGRSTWGSARDKAFCSLLCTAGCQQRPSIDLQATRFHGRPLCV